MSSISSLFFAQPRIIIKAPHWPLESFETHVPLKNAWVADDRDFPLAGSMILRLTKFPRQSSVYFNVKNMTEKFVYLIDRLHRAGKRIDFCQTKEERMQAQQWLVLWNRAVQLEYGRQGTKSTTR